MWAYLNSERFDVVGAVGASSEVGQVELNLIPAVVESHGHGANEGLDSRGTLVVARPEATAHVLVVEDLHLEREVLLQILDDHDEKGQLDAEGLLRVGGARDVGGAHIGADDLEHERLNVVVGDALDVSIAHLLVPDLQRLRAYTVQNGQESTLKCVFEHVVSSVMKRKLFLFNNCSQSQLFSSR